MATHSRIKENSAYFGSCIILTTKHAKSIAIGPPFWEKLGASILEYIVDTDKLGTFSGEVKREGSALECARKKCEWSLNKLGNKVQSALASEGSFGPHPFIPFLPCDQEILYFIDRKRDFHLYRLIYSEKTNYRVQTINTWKELQEFSEKTLFPSHALILRPNENEIKEPIFKGIISISDLEAAFKECVKYSSDKKVWVETDMRAQFNPSRMKVIGELADQLAAQLATHCPRCHFPGFGKIRQEKGLKCSLCHSETDLIKTEIHGCVKCGHEEISPRSDGLNEANPANCQYCNP